MVFSSCSKDWHKQGAYKLNITDASYIFKTSATKSLGAEEEGYWKMTVNGALEPLTLQDEAEKPIESTITEIWEMGDNFLGMSYHNSTIFKDLFVDKKTGKVYYFPDNVETRGAYFSDYNLKAWATEYNGKIYLQGKNPIGDNIRYYVEVDVSNQTSTRCTPDNLSATNLTVGKDGLIAFVADGYWFVMTPEKKLKRFGKQYEVHVFNDKNRDLFLISWIEEPYKEPEHSTYTIERISLDNTEIANEFICEFEADLYGCGFNTSINSQNNNTMLFCYYIYEFDGKSVKKVADIGPDWTIVDGKGFDRLDLGLVHRYYFEFPSDNFFIVGVDHNLVKLQRLDLKTYELVSKTLELYPRSEYILSGDVKHNGNQLTYSCVRFSDSHLVSFVMDWDGNRQIISENSDSFPVSQFLTLN